MAESDKIRSKDIIQEDIFKNTIESGSSLVKVLKSIEDQFKSNLDIQEKYLKSAGKKMSSADDITKTNAAIKESTETRKKLNKVEQERIKLEEKLSQLDDEAIKDNIRLKSEIAQKTKALKDQVEAEEVLTKTNEKLIKSYADESKRLNVLRKQYKDLIIQEGKATKETSELLKEIQELDKKLKDIDASVGQFQRSVGDYSKQALGSAKATAAFALAAVGLKGNLDDLKDGIGANEEAGEDFRTITEQIGAGLQVVQNRVGTAAKGLFDLGKQIISGDGNFFQFIGTINKVSNSFSGVVDEINDVVDAQEKVTKDTIQFEKELLTLNEALAKVNGQLEIQNAIAGDSTRGFNELEKAAKEVQKLQIERAAILEDIARREIDLVNRELAARSGLSEEIIKNSEATELFAKVEKNLRPLIEKRTEASIKLIEAENELAAAQIENAKVVREIQRDRFERELDFAIDAFDAQKTLNERRLTDERLTLEQRDELAKRTTELADSSFAEQIKLVEGFTKQKLNIDQLALEEDEKVIRERLRQYTLDDVTLGRILEVIRERKAVTQDLADIEKDISDAKLEQFNREKEAQDRINEENRTFQIEQYQRELELIEKQEEEKGNFELSKRQEINSKIYEARKADLIRNADVEMENYELNAAERLEIQNKLNNDLQRLDWEYLDGQKELYEQQKDYIINITKDLTDEINNVFTELGNQLEQSFEQVNNSLEAQIEQRESNIDKQRELASKGLENTLQFEEKKLAEARIRQQQELERQQKIEEAIRLTQAYFAAFQARVDENPDQAPFLALKDVALAKGIATGIKSLVGYFDGTEDTGSGGGVDDRGGFLSVLHPHERVMTKAQNSKVGSLSNDELANIAMMYNKGQLVNPFTDMAINVINKDKVKDNTHLIVQGIKDLKKSIDTKPVQMVNVDSLGNLVEVIYRNGIKETIKHKRNWL